MALASFLLLDKVGKGIVIASMSGNEQLLLFSSGVRAGVAFRS